MNFVWGLAGSVIGFFMPRLSISFMLAFAIFFTLFAGFGTFTAVDNLSFTVQPGRVTGFLGPNGAGKTSVIKMLLGLVRRAAELHPLGAGAKIAGSHGSECASDAARTERTDARWSPV